MTLGGIALAAVGLWTGLQVSIAEIRKDRQYDQVRIAENQNQIAQLHNYRGNDREQVIELKGDMKLILRAIRNVEETLRVRAKDDRLDNRPQ